MQYVIRSRQFYYNGKPDRFGLVAAADSGSAQRFDSIAAARVRIAELNKVEYSLKDGEYSRPVYRVVRVTAVPSHLKALL